MDPTSLRWIAFSHFEADECGALNYWLQEARDAKAACSANGALVSVGDYAFGKVRQLADGETFSTGSHTFRFLATPHLPHGWDAGHLYDETAGVLFCSDLLHQVGDVPAAVGESRVDAMRAMLESSRGTPLDWYVPWTPQTRSRIERWRRFSRGCARRCTAPPTSATAPQSFARWPTCSRRSTVAQRTSDGARG